MLRALEPAHVFETSDATSSDLIGATVTFIALVGRALCQTHAVSCRSVSVSLSLIALSALAGCDRDLQAPVSVEAPTGESTA